MSKAAKSHLTRPKWILEEHLFLAFAVSILIHLLLIGSIRPFSFVKEQIIEIEIVPEFISKSFQPPQKEQIVSEPDKSQATTSEKEARFLAEREARTEREQIQRGDGLDAGKSIGASTQKAEAKTAESKQKSNSNPKAKQALTQLKLDPQTAIKQFGSSKPAADQKDSPLENAPMDVSRYTPFSRPYGSGAAFLGNYGSSDYLPNLPDGDITLLNTKADKFAVFVRRVASQVFGELRLSGWDGLRSTDIRQVSKFSTVRAILSPKGKLLKVALEDSSGSSRFDNLLVDASKSGARDPNPPAGALASDGNIHFIFKSRSWVNVLSDPRTGAPYERRWLLLGTGLE